MILKNSCIVLTGFILITSGCRQRGVETAKYEDDNDYYTVADFQTKGTQRYGTWDMFPGDITSSVNAEIADGSLRVAYDVYSNTYAKNGVEFYFDGMDFSDFSSIRFIIKGSKSAGFPQIIDLRIYNDEGEEGDAVISGLSGQWGVYSVPLRMFRGVEDLSSVDRLEMVFCSFNTFPKTGMIFIDRVFLERKRRRL